MKLKYTFRIQEVCDTFIAVALDASDQKDSKLVNLNSTGKRIFELIQEGRDEDDIVRILLSEYDAAEPIIRKEVDKVVDALEKEELLEK